MKTELVNRALISTDLPDFNRTSKLYPIEERNSQPIRENIRGIFLSCLSIEDEHLKEHYLNEFQKVCDFSECTKLTPEGIRLIPQYAPNLTHLYLRAIPKLNGECLQSIATLSHLKCLDISQNYFDPKQLHHLSKLTHLKSLFLGQCRLIENEDLSWLKEKKLEILDVSYCNQLSNHCLKYLTCIQKIFLDGINFIDSEGVLELVETSSVLKSLSLERCPEVEISLFTAYRSQKPRIVQKVKSKRKKAFLMTKLKNSKDHKKISKKSIIKIRLRLAKLEKRQESVSFND